ncbi:MAG: altronate dehydratase family protein [Lachnospiraceae bacterium]|nr:altronate dehydratase family protein [Lachnospiraceae bacterium]
MDHIRIHPDDNVAVALRDISAGESIGSDGTKITVKEDIERGHKIALSDIRAGSFIIKYGCPIGRAAGDISSGSKVHLHNVMTDLSESNEYIYDPVRCSLPPHKARTFMGYKRQGGRTGIRNEIWIIPTVGCVNEIARRLARENRHLARGSIDGIYAFTHPYGCSQTGDDHNTTRKVLTALAGHPNAGGVLVLSLGCENLTVEQFKNELGQWEEDRVRFLTCQNVEDEIGEGSRLLEELASYASKAVREETDASELIVGLKCGGSDGLSGITANPAVGRFSDLLISMGGSTVLTEVPEMFGAETILFNRCKDRDTFDRAVAMVNGFKKYYTDHGQPVYENPSPGNKAGGITTLEDKSCGCVQKGGNAQIVDVLGYADPVKMKGLSLLSGPGNDMVSTTDLTAAGAHMILFTTGRGTPFGAPVPTVRISTNTELFRRKRDWIDFNAGTVADGTETLDEAGERLLDLALAVAGGKKTGQEINGYREIAIFKDGVTL